MAGTKAVIPDEKLINYVEEMVSNAIRNGEVNPVVALECFLHATNEDLVIALREFCGLAPETRRHLLDHAKKLPVAQRRPEGATIQ